MTVQNIINEISKKLKDVPGIVGVVWGGSRAIGTNRAASDIDIGIYYDGATDFDVNEVGKIATNMDDKHRENLVTALGESGDWINGSGSIVVQGYHIELIFRDINRVSEVIDDCLEGKVSAHYHRGHPYAYLNVMHMGKISICNILYERAKQISALKAKTTPFPKALKDAIVGYFMFEANFSLMFAKDHVDRDGYRPLLQIHSLFKSSFICFERGILYQ